MARHASISDGVSECAGFRRSVREGADSSRSLSPRARRVHRSHPTTLWLGLLDHSSPCVPACPCTLVCLVCGCPDRHGWPRSSNPRRVVERREGARENSPLVSTARPCSWPPCPPRAPPTHPEVRRRNTPPTSPKTRRHGPCGDRSRLVEEARLAARAAFPDVMFHPVARR